MYGTQWPWLGHLKHTAEKVSQYLKCDQFEATCGNFDYYVKEKEMRTKQTNKHTHITKLQQSILHIHTPVTHKVLIKSLPPIYPTAWSTLIAPLQIILRVTKRLVSIFYIFFPD